MTATTGSWATSTTAAWPKAPARTLPKSTRVRFLPERDVQQNGAVTRNLVGKDVFWVDVETMGTNPDKVESPDDEQEGSGQGSFG